MARLTPPASTPPGVRLVVLRARADFLRAARARSVPARTLVVQARKRTPAEAQAAHAIPADAIRVGFTCSRRVGGAVARNRAKRRLREAARHALPGIARPGWDYVLIGRAERTACCPFGDLVAHLRRSVAKAHDAA